ncbi:MAG: DUF1189 family protein [Acidobacteria bacterium]|nr:DUF1189 family protein [Acidobacteriota bacterium]
MDSLKHSYLSVTDFEFYATIARQPLGRSVRYLLLWITFTAVFSALVFFVRYYPTMAHVSEWLIQNMPAMEVKQGKLAAAVAAPHRMALSDLDLRVVVDPSNSVRKAEKQQGAEVIFNSDRIYVQIHGREDSYQFAERDNFQINRQSLETMRAMLRLFFIPFSLVLFWPYYLLAKGLQVLFLAACGLTLRRPEWRQLQWRHWTNVAIYALTPAMLIGMIFQLTTVPALVAWFFYISTALLYTLLAARRCSQVPPEGFQ